MLKMFTIQRQSWWNKANMCTRIILNYLLCCPSSRKLKLHYKHLKFPLQDEQKNGKTPCPILHKVQREIRLIFMQLT